MPAMPEPYAHGEYRRCVRNGLATMFGFVDTQIEPGLWGGYATHLHLPSDAMLLPIPDSLDPVLATVFNPLGAGIRWGATIPETKSGDVVVVLGPGIHAVFVPPLLRRRRVSRSWRSPVSPSRS